MDRPILDSSLQFDGPRSPKESEFKKLLEFLDANLRKGNEWSIAREYPTALSLGNLHNIRMVTDGEEICSHAVLKPLIVKTPLLPIKVGAIGSVVTESSHRNKGLSKKLLEDCLGLAQKQDCDVAILWTNLYDFYRKLGFELAGTEMSFVVENEFRGPLHHLRFIEDNKISPDALLRIYMQHTVTTHRSAEEVRKFMQIPNTRIYSAWDSVGSLAAYAIEGKGADLSGYIHEWGGNVPALMALFSHIRKSKGTPITVIAPRHSSNLINALKNAGFISHEGYLGMIKLVHPEVFFSRIKKAARSLGIADLVLEKKDSTYAIGVGSQILETEQESEVIKLIFGPFLPRELVPLDRKSVDTFERIFPLPFWLWGWDSI